MSVGDVNSNELGSGARYNDGKPDYSLILYKFLPVMSWMDHEFFAFMHEYQLTGEIEPLKNAYQYLLNFAYCKVDEEYMDSVVRVWEAGREKYNAFNWTKGMAWSIPVACAARHYMAMSLHDNPRARDDETGEYHVAHMLCNLQMSLHYHEHFPQGNNLPIQVK